MSSALHTFPGPIPTFAISRLENDEIAALAYLLWEERGCPVGSPDEDWLLAEAKLTNPQRVAATA